MSKTEISNLNENEFVEGEQKEIHDEEREKIRAEISNMSFAELQKLKEEMGSKLYNKALYGTKKTIKKTQTVFKRENKNRPREMSAKKQVPLLREIPNAKKIEYRDPRFDERAGEFNKKAFENSYSFIKDIKLRELSQLKKDLKNTEDPEEADKIKFLVTRMENQFREEKKIEEKKQKELTEKMERLEQIKEGKVPVYRKKSEKRILDLVEKYENLKKTGGVRKNIMKREKKKVQKDRKSRKN